MDNEFNWEDMEENEDALAAFAAALERAAQQAEEMVKIGEQFYAESEFDFAEQPEHIYLAGPMRGITRFNVAAFDEAEALLSAQGFKVFNPAQRDREEGLDHSLCPFGTEDEMAAQGFDMGEALAVDLSYVVACADAIALLPGWMMSKGAVAELAAAKAVGIGIYEFDQSTGQLEPLDIGETRCASCDGKAASAPLSARLVMLAQEAVTRYLSRLKLWAMRRGGAR